MEHLIPSFYGKAGFKSPIDPDGETPLKNIISNDNYSIEFTPRNTTNCYTLLPGKFIWSGGDKLGERIEGGAFDKFHCDSKFILVEFNEGSVSVSSDHYSRIPLFYCYKNNLLHFSSSLQLLLKMMPEYDLTLNEKGLVFQYSFGFPAYDQFPFEGIKCLPAGHTLTFDKAGLNLHRYYDLIAFSQGRSQSFEENKLDIDRCLLDSVKRSIAPYDKIGLALSGGVDSGYLAQKVLESGKSLVAYTLGYEGAYDEFSRAEKLRDLLGFELKKIMLSPEEIISNYLEVSEYSSLPVGFNNSVLNFIYKEASKDGIETVLDGDGADRLFLGMNQYLKVKKFITLHHLLKKYGLSTTVQKLLSFFPSGKFDKVCFQLSRMNDSRLLYGERTLQEGMGYDPDFEALIDGIALPGFLKKSASNLDFWDFYTQFSVYYTPVFFFHTPYELVLKHGMTSNPAFWSDPLVHHALKIPADQKLANGQTKFVLQGSC